MVEVMCKVCGRPWKDKRYEALMKRGIDVCLRTCCDECVEEIFKKEYDYNPEEIKRIVKEKRALPTY